MHKETKYAETYPVNMSLVHQMYKGKMMTTPRDFCVIEQTTFNKDGSILKVLTSVNDSRVPQHKDFVRAIYSIAGWLFKPTGDGKTLATYVSLMDMAGSIPSFIQNMAAKGQAKVVKMFGDGYAKRYLKK